jgi:hypothetical protein
MANTLPGGNGTDKIDLPEGVSPDSITQVEGVNSDGETIQTLNLEQKADGISVVTAKDTTLTGKPLHNSVVSAKAGKGETTAITADTHTKNSSITNKGKGALEANITGGKHKDLTISSNKGAIAANLTGGSHKNLTISSSKKKVNDNVDVSNGVTLKNSSMELGKGSDSVRFGKKVNFKGKHSIDLGKRGKDEVVFKADDVTDIKMTITSFSKKDTIEVGDETFTYKDIKNGAEIPGIKVELA